MCKMYSPGWLKVAVVVALPLKTAAESLRSILSTAGSIVGERDRGWPAVERPSHGHWSPQVFRLGARGRSELGIVGNPHGQRERSTDFRASLGTDPLRTLHRRSASVRKVKTGGVFPTAASMKGEIS